jgi:hypothetical protein
MSYLAYLLAGDIEQRDLVAGELGGQGALAVRREDDVRHLLADHDSVDQLDLLAGDAQDVDRAVGAVGDQRQRPGTVDRQARRLLAERERIDQLRRARRQVDHPEAVVRNLLQDPRLVDDVDRIGHQRQALVGRDREVGRRADDGVGERQADDGLRRERIAADVDHRHGVAAGRGEHRRAGVVPALLLVVAHDHQRALARRRGAGGAAAEGERDQHRGDGEGVVHVSSLGL